MPWIVIKYAVSAALVVTISEVAKRSGKLGALLAALPLVSLMALVWLHAERQPDRRIADQAYYTFWYVLPTLPMFLFFPQLLRHCGFWLGLTLGAMLTCVLFGLLVLLARRFGLNLL